MAFSQSQMEPGATRIAEQRPFTRSQFVGEVKEADPAAQALTLTISTEDEDRDGDVILASGWDLRSYKKNPVVLFAHRYDMPAVAKADRIWVEGRTLQATVQFAPTAFGQELWALYAGGFMQAASVGFVPLEEPMEREPKRPGHFRSFLYKKQELLEFSLVPVPSNPEALVSAKNAGLSVAMVEKAVCGALPDMAPPDKMGDPSDLAPILKGPISYASAHRGGTAKTDEDAAWDGPAEVGKAEGEAQLRRMHTWIDSDKDPETKAAYKLPHHQADGTLVWRGVAAAMGALMGARGGVDIPEADMPGCHGHLSKHYSEFGREAPSMASLESVSADSWEVKTPDAAMANPIPEPHIRQSTIADELDYLKYLLSREQGLSVEVRPVALEVLAILTRDTGYVNPVEHKTGAVLNRKNKESLKQAQDLIQQVLDSAEPQMEQVDPDRVAALVAESLSKKLGG